MQFLILKRVVMAVLSGLMMNQASSVLADNQTGTYYLFVKHTTTGTDSYDVSAHCKTSGNVHAGTCFISRQQQ